MVAAAGGSTWPVSLYIIVLGVITVFAVWYGPETYRNHIADDAELSGRAMALDSVRS